MLPDYDDIRRRIVEAPKWFTTDGVPRYDVFTPSDIGIYDQHAALFVCVCQACHAKIQVGVGWSRADDFRVFQARKERGESPDAGGWLTGPEPPTPTDPGWCAMGDPPRHDCAGAGETMTSSTVRVLEYWIREQHEWVRHPEHEIVVNEDAV
jgi:hypothetical protein